jgi:hypothetical protein
MELLSFAPCQQNNGKTGIKKVLIQKGWWGLERKEREMRGV